MASKLRATMYIVWVLCFILSVYGGYVIPLSFKGQNFVFGLGLELIIATFGMSLAFVVTHILIFTEKGGSQDISVLVGMFMVYMLTVTLHVSDEEGIYWLQAFIIVIFVLGVEYLVPNWPGRIIKLLSRKNMG